MDLVLFLLLFFFLLSFELRHWVVIVLDYAEPEMSEQVRKMYS